jgi:NADPH2:quinone reductase
MALPSTMRAVTQSGPGGPEVLRVETLPVPQPGSGQVLIRVAWAGVNPHDIGQRKRGAPPPGQTPVFGLECSGEIVAVGADVDARRIGEKVCALTPGGAYAQYCLSPAGTALTYPQAISEREAGAIMENLFTAWFNMMELAGLKPGERVLAHGGTGSVGSTAIMIASLIGAEAYGTVGTEEKRRICLGLGAKAAVNYRSEDVVKAVMAATGGAGVDVIVETVGTGYAEKNLEMLAKDGRIVYISGGKGQPLAVPVSAIMGKRARVMGSLMRPLELPRKLKVAAELRERVWPVLGSRIKPLIDSEFTLDTAADGHRRSESGDSTGKIMIRVA